MNPKLVPSKDVVNKILNKEELFILDVRNNSDYNDWKIQGENITSLNIPYFDLLDGVEDILDELPTDKEILVVCAKEGSSAFVANMLAEEGLDNIGYLKGGMKSWSEELYQTVVYDDEDIKVIQFMRVGKGCLSYMIQSGEEALVIDASRFYNVYDEIAKQSNAKITHIVDTHLHADHISGGKALSELVGAKYYIMKSEGAIFDFLPLEEYDGIDFAKAKVRTLAVKTPGHTPGSVSFLLNDKLIFTGDTLFIGGIGRPDLGGKVREWANDLYSTVYEKLSKIDDDVIVLPGHFADLDSEVNNEGYIGDLLGNIKSRNDMMNNKTREVFVDTIESNAKQETPPNFEKVIEINKGQTYANDEEMQEIEIGPNRCALQHSN
ncbi:MAG: MBL fold metallo-hydrolase [Peptostreptococcaceae bacterium]